jgi:Zn-dependent protease with chaperone function
MALVFAVFDFATILHTNWHLGAVPVADELAVVATLAVPLLTSWALFAGAAPGGVPGVRVATAVGCQVRHFLLLPLLPILVIAGGNDLLRALLPSVADAARGPLAGLVVCALVLGFPELLRRCWQTKVLASGPARERIVEMARRANVELNEILAWQTGMLSANAAVAGFLPKFRYLFVTDQLLWQLEPERLAAIAAHEVAHCRHHHLPRLALTLALPFAGGFVMSGIGHRLGVTLGAGSPLAALALLLLWSRVHCRWARAFEHQADLTACRLLSPGQELRRDAVETFGQALWATDPHPDGDWLHPAPAQRMAFLTAVLADRQTGIVFERRLRYSSIVQGAALALLLLGGWILA